MRVLHVYSGNLYGGIETLLVTMARARALCPAIEPQVALWAHDVATGTHWTERIARRVRPDLVICNSRYTADSLRRLYESVPSIVLMYPVDTNAAVLTAAERAALRQELDTPADGIVLI